MLKRKKRILELSIVLGCALFISCGNFLFKIITANILDTVSYGYFISLLAVIALVSTFVGAGLADYWLEIFSKLKLEANSCIKSSFIYIFITYISSLFIIILYLISSGYPTKIEYVFYVVMPSVISGTITALVVSLLRAKREHLKSSIILAIPVIVNLSVFIPDLLSSTKLSLDSVIIKYAISNLLVLIFSLTLLASKIKGMNIEKYKQWNFSSVFSGSFYYGLSAFFYMVYYQGDILIISYYKGGEEVAFYSVGFTLVSVSFILASVICQRYFLPELHSSFSTDKVVFLFFIKKVIPIMAAFSTLIFLGYILLSERMIYIFYDKSYSPAEVYIKALAMVIPIKYISLGLGAAITASGRIKEKTKIMLILSLVNIILNITLVPKFGAVSAAYTTVICELILMIAFMFKIKQVIK